MFESDSVPGTWIDAIRGGFQGLWLPSTFTVRAFSKALRERMEIEKKFSTSVAPLPSVIVVPEAIDEKLFDPDRTDLQQLSLFDTPERWKARGQRVLKLLSVFKWERRKGWDVLLEGFLKAFTPEDPVILYILTHPHYNSTSIEQDIESWMKHEVRGITMDRLRQQVVLIQQRLPQSMLPDVYHSVDAFVLPSRGEAWGRPYMEAMAMSLPVVATIAGGQSDVMVPDYYSTDPKGPLDPPLYPPPSLSSPTVERVVEKYPIWVVEVDERGEEVPVDWDYLAAGHRWASPIHSSLSKQLRELYQYFQLLQNCSSVEPSTGNVANSRMETECDKVKKEDPRPWTISRFNPKQVGKSMIDALSSHFGDWRPR